MIAEAPRVAPSSSSLKKNLEHEIWVSVTLLADQRAGLFLTVIVPTVPSTTARVSVVDHVLLVREHHKATRGRLP